MFRLFFICVLITLGITLAALFAGLGVMQYIVGMLPSEDAIGIGWLYSLMFIFAWVIAAGALVMGLWLTFWSLVILVANFFDEAIAEKIERARYPTLPIGTTQPFWPELRHDLGFLFKIITLNLLVIIIPIFWPVLPFALMALNGYLVGQEFFVMAGGRHLGRRAAYQLAKQHRLPIFCAGLAMIIGSTVPILNLAIPFWGVAMMVHLYHQLGTPQQAPLPLPAPSHP